ncbi:MAG: sensor histidine kinase [Lachnospiraceae bacterium]|nr:sensor histidine kinase [Lachnospiraceae bacterium]
MEKARKKYRHVFQDMSIRKKIFFGYLAIIGIVLLCVIALFPVLWEKLNKDSISKSIYSSNYQIVKSIDNYFDSVKKLSEFPYLDSEIMDILRKDYQGISEERKMIEQIQDVNAINPKIYKHIYYMHNQIDGVFLYPENMDYFAYRCNHTVIGNYQYNIRKESWYDTVRNGNGRPYIIGVHTENAASASWKVLSVARSILDPSNGKYLGMIVIDCAVESFADLWDSSPYSESIITVADKSGNFILPQNLEYTEGLVEELQNFSEEGENLNTLRFDNQTWYVAVTKLNYIEGYVYQLVPITDALKNMAYVFLAVLAAVIFIGALLIFISAKISNTITQPINRLIVQMETVESGNLSLQPEVYHGEMQVLAEKFDHMVSQVHMMFEEVKETEKEKREMEMLALQAQINPHFLYNTLNSILWLSELQGADKVTQMLDSLIKVLQYTVDNTKEFVRVRDEVAFIHNYIRILNFRYFERFSFIFDIKEDTLEYEMPRFILQPLVENAVLHGFDNNDLNATVKLSIHLQDGELFLCVSDDGRGMPEEKIREILHTDSSSKKRLNKIGLYNVNQRICLTYGEEYAIHIDSKVGCFTKVTVRIPAQNAAGEEQK